MDLDLQQKVAIVTGASQGIGRAIALRLSAEGARVVLVARSAEKLAAVAAECVGETLVLAMDLRDVNAPAQLIDAVLAQFGQLDILVNNAGATQRGDFLALSDADWQDGFDLKFYAAMRCSRAAWPYLQARRGVIINIAGLGGRTGSAEFTIGGAVNAALLNLTKSLADRGVSDGIRVNAINPGSIQTARLQKRIATLAHAECIDFDAAAQKMAKQQGTARFGLPEEIANVAAFLASPAAAYCHGAIWDVDGGQTRTL
ncbi:SDR family NAD(P)-dependent oxidoreductase [Deefgea rivuli]|uniref:SDR family NAD(P)-dependent oxidoreductase n=1 Tax=Deefgea rivuli TaxID=400948 RepID=UPI0004805AAC|nr:SDR family oxidoreductase [Deefgea rivuli]